MHSDSFEPSEGAALSVSRGVSSAEKRAEYESLGLEWPRYPDGTDRRWDCDPRRREGGFWRSWESVTKSREHTRKRDFIRRTQPGTCGRNGCETEKHRNRTGTYEIFCYGHHLSQLRERKRKELGWYDEGGMATKPTQFKELNNG